MKYDKFLKLLRSANRLITHDEYVAAPAYASESDSTAIGLKSALQWLEADDAIVLSPILMKIIDSARSNKEYAIKFGEVCNKVFAVTDDTDLKSFLKWLTFPNRELSGRSPISMFENEKTLVELEKILNDILYVAQGS